jgi:hypothetical protein
MALLLLSSCGYHVGGQAELVPSAVKTIAIPAFSNSTIRYKLTDHVPEAIAKEFISRSKYRVVSNTDAADAVLRGAILNYSSFPTILDPSTSRASGVELRVTMQVTLTERATGKVLFSNPRMEVRERYQIATDPTLYYEESEDALNRASREVARTVVSDILNAF